MLVVALCLDSLELLHALLDLLGSLGETVVGAGGLGLHGHGLHPNVVGLVHRRERHGVAAASVEVDSEESPLTLNCVRNTLDGADVDRDESSRGVRDENCVSLGVHVDLAWLNILGVVLSVAVGLDSVHLLDLLLGLRALNLALVKSDLEISLLELVQLRLVPLAIFHLIHTLLLVISL